MNALRHTTYNTQNLRETGKERGQALIVALIFLLAITFLGLGLILVSSMDIHTSRNLRLAEKAMNAAEEGILVGMAFASDTRSGFVALAQEESIIIRSYDPGGGDHFNLGKDPKDDHHFEVEVMMGGNAPVPPGEAVGEIGVAGAVVFRGAWVRSTGYVLEEAGAEFNPASPPLVSRRIEVLARIRYQQ